jgi:DNA-directed RNA polymerase subunit K/omega
MSDDKIESSNSLDDIRSRYEMVMIAGREARRLNELARTNGKELKRRVTEVAWERLQTGKVYFSYQEPPREDENEVPRDMVPDLIDPPKADVAPETPAPAVEEGA